MAHYKQLPKEERYTIGAELKRGVSLEIKRNMGLPRIDTSFADPCAIQRARNENTNGLIRQ